MAEVDARVRHGDHDIRIARGEIPRLGSIDVLVAPAARRTAFCSARETPAPKPTISSPSTAFGVCEAAAVAARVDAPARTRTAESAASASTDGPVRALKPQ